MAGDNLLLIVIILLLLYYFVNGSCNSKTTEKFIDISVDTFINNLNSLSKNLSTLYNTINYSYINDFIIVPIESIIKNIKKNNEYNNTNVWTGMINNVIQYYDYKISIINKTIKNTIKLSYDNVNTINNLGDIIYNIDTITKKK